ncbi:Uncharacterised protein [Klebsiella pneumoniae]|nr:Uncharacterised protein [Klebsiella pneumoniae]
MVGILADNAAHAPCIEELIFAFAQVQSDFRAAIFFSDVGDGVFALTGRFPEHAFIGGSAGCAGAD